MYFIEWFNKEESPVPDKVEDAAKEYADKYYGCNPSIYYAFIYGAKWQAQQSDAVEFAEWASIIGWRYYPKDKEWGKKEVDGSLTVMKSKELYNLFKKSKQ